MRWPLTARDEELAAIMRAFAGDASAGVVLTGPAGVGKSRLLDEAAALAEDRGAAVVRIRGTRAAASLPLGPFAPVLPAGDPARHDVELLAQVRVGLRALAGGRRLVLCVDDAHLLDDASAALVHQLAAGREAVTGVTVRSGVPVPDAVRGLWKDELCERVELHELAQADVARLLERALGGAVDRRSAATLWQRTRGNVLFLRELVRHGLERGLLAEEGGVWRWRGEDAGIGARLVDVIDARMDALDPRGRAVLELVAAGAPLELEALSPDERAELEALEEHEFVELRRDGRRRVLDVVHPLHAEALRAQVPSVRWEGRLQRLAEAVEAWGARRGGDLPRLAAWRLESGHRPASELFERAALHALGAYDGATAERFGRAAVEAGGGWMARLTLARALAFQGQATAAEEALAEIAGDARTDSERVAVAIAMARNRFWGLGRADGADAVLHAAAQAVHDRTLRDELRAQRIRLTAAAGRPQAALAAAGALLEDGGAGDQPRVHAAVAAVDALIGSGRTGEALVLVDRWTPVARRVREQVPPARLVPVLELVLASERAMALRFAGRLREATDVSAALLATSADEQPSTQNTAVESASLAYVWLARGRPRTALRLLRESAALLGEADAVGMRGWALAGVAQAAAQLGDAQAASAAAEEMTVRALGHKGFEPELGIAAAWAAAARGERSRAIAVVRAAAALAHDRGQSGFEVRVLHEACRLGAAGEAAPRLRTLAAGVDGEGAQAAAAHAQALAAGDAQALLAAAERLAAMDALLVAAEAAHAASALLAAEGRAASARSAAARGRVWLADCEGACPPTLAGAAAADELTAREREIAMLAAGGLRSREIAERLVVSVRTVDNHLQRAYRKLGVSRRDELAAVLRAGPE